MLPYRNAHRNQPKAPDEEDGPLSRSLHRIISERAAAPQEGVRSSYSSDALSDDDEATRRELASRGREVGRGREGAQARASRKKTDPGLSESRRTSEDAWHYKKASNPTASVRSSEAARQWEAQTSKQTRRSERHSESSNHKPTASEWRHESSAHSAPACSPYTRADDVTRNPSHRQLPKSEHDVSKETARTRSLGGASHEDLLSDSEHLMLHIAKRSQRDLTPCPTQEYDDRDRLVKSIINSEMSAMDPSHAALSSDTEHVAQHIVQGRQAEPVDAHQSPAATLDLAPTGECDDRERLVKSAINSQIAAMDPSQSPAETAPGPTREYDNRGRLVKSEINSQLSEFEQPGAYSAIPGENYRRRTSSRRLSHLLGSSAHGGGEDALPSAPLTTEVTERSSLDAASRPKNETLPNEVPQEEERRRARKRAAIVVGLLVAVVAILAIFIPVSIVLLGDDSYEDPPHLLDVTSQDSIDLGLVPNLTNTTIEALMDADSPQSMAFAWISKDPNWDTYEDWRKQQRFAMMCFFYAIEGDINTMVVRFLPSYYIDECSWIAGVTICNENGAVRYLHTANLVATIYVHIPPEISLLPQLESIEFDAAIFYSLEAALPLNVPNSFPALQQLILRDCQMDGAIPSELGLLTGLTHLDLSENALSSTVPSELGVLSNLKSLMLSSNSLSGTIPDEIEALSSLALFHIEDNPSMEPFIPAGLCEEEQSLEELQTDWCSTPAECCTLP